MATHEIKVLNVAEKPSVAREITKHLGGGARVVRNTHGVQVADFPYTLMQTQCRMLVTSVRGHLVEVDFPSQYKSWQAMSPAALFAAPVQRSVSKECSDIDRTLKELARQCQWLVLWLDCDREGEAIAFEVIEVCQRAAHRELRTLRAVFSALTRADIINACNTLRPPDARLAHAVEARREIDLRTGAAFTRWMTLRYQQKIPALDSQVLSYGSCQFPTLGFVVERWLRIQRFVPEPFWSIRMEVDKDNRKISFQWCRGRLFDRLATLALFEIVVESARRGATVTRVTEEPKTRWRPLPLNTVELAKLSASRLRIAPARCMVVAEELYTRGFISYPRTETDRFQSTIDVRALVNVQGASSAWGQHAQMLIHAGRFTTPRSGPHDDNAHPPIHPVRCAERDQVGGDEHWRVYELVTRHFLACCSPDAQGQRTVVEAELGEELFTTVGLVIRDRGWLDVYPYATWCDTPLPAFAVDERLTPTVLEMTESRTQPPPLLSEADLISIMDRNGIGTDATMHEHIQKIQSRDYVTKTDDGRLQPTNLGVALIQGYQRFALEEGLDLSKPQLRAQMERAMTEIAQGSMSREDFLAWCIERTQRCYAALERNAPALDAALKHHLGYGEAARAAPLLQASFSACRCGAQLDLRCLTIDASTARGGGPAGGGTVPRGRATSRGRGRGGRAASASASARGRGRNASSRGRGAGRGRAQSARPASASRQPRHERFLVCPNAACALVLSVPSRTVHQLVPHPHVCPICGFQVVTVRDESIHREHQLCPYCFNNAPPDLHPNVNELRCFRCAHATCPLAGVA